MALSKAEILGIVDIEIKEIDVSEWKDTVFIKQLSRGDQDEYLKKQFGSTRLKQNTKANQQEISAMNIYGHDAFLCQRGICDKSGKLLFSGSDIAQLKKKSGAAIGRIAKEIVEFSGMADDIEELEELKN